MPEIKKMNFKKGVSESIALIIGLALVFFIVFPFVFVSLGILSRSSSYLGNKILYEKVLEEEKLVIGYNKKAEYMLINITNAGTSFSEIKYILLVLENKTSLMYYIPRLPNFIKITPNNSWNKGSLIRVKPGDTIYLNITKPMNIGSIVFITSKGNSFALSPELFPQSIGIVKAESIIARPVIINLTYGDLKSRFNVSDDYQKIPTEDNPGKGIRGVYGSLVLERRYVNITLFTQNDLKFGTLAIGYDAQWLLSGSKGQPRYIILLTWDPAYGYGGSLIIQGSIMLSFNKYLCPYGYRVKIEGFSGEIRILNSAKEPPLILLYGSSKYNYKLRLYGTAEDFKVYCRNPRIQESSYEPYLLIGDFDGNKLPELLLITEDIFYGDLSSRNDVLRSDLEDYSIEPLSLTVLDIPINNEDYALVVFSIRFYYHDNAYDDIEECDNRLLFRVGLYDPELRTVITSRDYTFTELARYRRVYPPSWSYIVHSAVLYVPDPSVVGNKTYYIVIELRDPYGEYKTNDADIFIAIEYLGVILYERRD